MRCSSARPPRIRSAPRCVHAGVPVPYARLNARANRIAHRLRALGVGPEVPVASSCPASRTCSPPCWGCSRRAARTCRWTPPIRRSGWGHAGRHARARRPHPHLRRRPPAAARRGRRWWWTRIAALDRAAEDDPHPLAAPENLAYVIYTSGLHRPPEGGADRAPQRVRRPPLAAGHGAGRGAGVRAGIHLRLLRRFHRGDVRARSAGAARWCWWPTRWPWPSVPASRCGWPAWCPPPRRSCCGMGAIPPTIRTLALGGEPLPRALAHALYAGTGVERILNLYGPTEDTTYSTCALITRATRQPGAPSGGRCRAQRCACSIRGAAAGAGRRRGGAVMAGAGVTRGYLRPPGAHGGALPSRSALRRPRRADVPHRRPGPAPRGRRVDCLGRIGPPGEDPRLPRGAGGGGGRPRRPPRGGRGRRRRAGGRRGRAAAGGVVGAAPARRRRGAAGLPARSGCRTTWSPPPSSRWTRCPALPNGKMDRLALPAPEGWSARRRTATWRRARRWRRSLCGDLGARCWGWSGVGVRDDFFALGGHSLRAVQIVARLRDALGVDVPLPAVFQARTVEALARRWSGRCAAAARRRRRASSRWTAPARSRSPPRRRRCGSSSGCRRGCARTSSRRPCACGATLDADALARALDGDRPPPRDLPHRLPADRRRSRCRWCRRPGPSPSPSCDVRRACGAGRSWSAVRARSSRGRSTWARCRWCAGRCSALRSDEHVLLCRGAPPGARRLVVRRLPARADGALRRVRARRAVAAAGAAAAVRATTRSGSAAWMAGARGGAGAGVLAAASWPARRRCWTCRRTSRARRASAFAASRCTCGCRRSWRTRRTRSAARTASRCT